MNDIIFENKYLSISYINHFGHKIIFQVWKEESASMTDDIFKVNTLKWLETFKNQPVKFALTDIRKLFYTITPKIKKWIRETFHKTVIELGLERTAYITRPDYNEAFDINEFYEEDETIDNIYVYKLQTALQWFSD